PGQRRQVQRSAADRQSWRANRRRSLTSRRSQRKKPRSCDRGFSPWDLISAQCASTASSSRATMLVILIIGFTAGPAVSLYGSPTVSPVTAALWASEPLPPKWPSSMYFLALSQAPPPAVIE